MAKRRRYLSAVEVDALPGPWPARAARSRGVSRPPHDEDAGVWRLHARFARDAGADDAADARRMARAHRTAARLLPLPKYLKHQYRGVSDAQWKKWDEIIKAELERRRAKAA